MDSRAYLPFALGLLCLACRPPAPAGVALVSTPPVSLTPARAAPTLQREDHTKKLTDAIAAFGETQLLEWSQQAPGKLLEHGLDEATLIGAIKAARRDCREFHCEDPGPEQLEAFAVKLLAKTGTRASFDYLDAKIVSEILESEMGEFMGPCAVPDQDIIDQEFADVGDFYVIDRSSPNSDDYRARPLKAQEREDLSYFLAAVREAGPEIGTVREQGVASAPLRASEDQEERAHLLLLIRDARKADDRQDLSALLRRYLVSLGYPGPIRDPDEGQMAWGGARYSFLFRELAWLLEVEGSFSEAAMLYRRANPGGGACGTSYDSYRSDQILGLIRSSEKSVGCAPVIPERLMHWNSGEINMYSSPAEQRAEPDYGPQRLADAGFDVERLYRGALLTRNRSIEGPLLRAAFDVLAPPHRERAFARLEKRGPEAWEARVHAAEGLTDTVGRHASTELLKVLPLLNDWARVRALVAIGELNERHWMGPCDPEWFQSYGIGWSNVWHRAVQPFATSCEEANTDREADALAKSLAPYARAPYEREVRGSTYAALGVMLSPRGKRILQREKRTLVKELAKCMPESDEDYSCDNLRWLESDVEIALSDYERLED